MKFTCIDCFSGAGGLALGLKKAGFEVICSFDNDPKCKKTHDLNKQYFDYPYYVSGIDSMLNNALMKKMDLSRGELFILAGGPPCQGFSIQRIGPDEDMRNELVNKFVSLIIELYPAYFLMENVPGLMGKRGKKVLESAIKKAEKVGYFVHRKVLDAQDFGVPQRRKRLFVIGERCSGGKPNFRFPEASTPEGKRITVKEIIKSLPFPPEDGSDHPEIKHHRRDRLSELNKKRLLKLKQGEGREKLPEELLADCHAVSANIMGHRNVYGRMRWDNVAPTITARFDSFTRGQFGHPEQLRSITLREGALLQTFPKDFLFSGNKIDIARQIGNAVPPILAELIGRQILKCQCEKLLEL